MDNNFQNNRFLITILGSGTSVPTAHRRPASHVVRSRDTALLMDCGSGCTTALREAGGDIETLDGLLFSHLHPDHTADLVPLLFSMANPVGPRRERDLEIWGPEGTAHFVEALRGVYGRWIRPRTCDLVVHEVGPGESWRVGELDITAFGVQHSGACLAFRLTDGASVLGYSGDSGPCDGLTDAARGADLFVCECALTEEEKVPGHMHARDVAQLAEEAGCQRVALVHLYERVIAQDPVSIVKNGFSGEVILGEDGLTIAVGAP